MTSSAWQREVTVDISGELCKDEEVEANGNKNDALDVVVVRPVEPGEVQRWLDLMRAHHYLGFGKSAGKRILYVATVGDEWVALLSWAAAALHVKCRDRWIGWDKAVKRHRLKQVTNNTRFLILPGTQIKNLASKVLALNLKRLRRDWRALHGYDVLLAETFVDPERYRGTCYLAQGWTPLGLTDGFGHDPRGTYAHHGKPKLMLVKELVRCARQRLRSLLADNVDTPKVIIDVAKLPLDDLVEHMRQIPRINPRRGQFFTEARLLAVAACALLAGADGYRELTRYAKSMEPDDLKRLGIKPTRLPSLWSLWRLLKRIDANLFDRHLTEWLKRVCPSDAMNDVIAALGGARPLPLLTTLRSNCG
ncbi:MAG: Druantia anti-phage system protein DruA [Acidiferrobacteraceae bacterium]